MSGPPARGIPMLDVALKEWAVVCDLLLEGEMALLLRKGGIAEPAGPGAFAIEHRRFALFPAWKHQRPELIRPPHRRRAQALDEPDRIDIRAVAEAVKTWPVTAIEPLAALDDLHPWTREFLAMRLEYRPERPLHLIALRASRLERPRPIPNRPAYAGCRSWVKLEPEDAVDERGAAPVIAVEDFESIIARIDDAMATGRKARGSP